MKAPVQPRLAPILALRISSDPVLKLVRVKLSIEVLDTRKQARLGVPDGLVVDHRTDLLENEVE